MLFGCVPVVLAVVAAGLPAAAHAAKRADLVITSVKAAPGQPKPLHRTALEPGPVKLRVTVENRGDGQTAQHPRARTETKRSGGLSFTPDDERTFGRVPPGEKTTFDIGAYAEGGPPFIKVLATRVCVSARGSGDLDRAPIRCRNGPGFAVIARAYDGSVKVTQPIFGYAKIVSIGDPRFTLDEQASQRRNRFVYRAAGQLVHTVSGSNGTCSISGSGNGNFKRDETELVFDTGLNGYQGSISHPQIVDATQTCNGTGFPAPVRTGGVRIGPEVRDDLSIDEPLTGNVTGMVGETYEWNLPPDL